MIEKNKQHISNNLHKITLEATIEMTNIKNYIRLSLDVERIQRQLFQKQSEVRAQHSGNAVAFQATEEGSIPSVRSKFQHGPRFGVRAVFLFIHFRFMERCRCYYCVGWRRNCNRYINFVLSFLRLRLFSVLECGLSVFLAGLLHIVVKSSC